MRHTVSLYNINKNILCSLFLEYTCVALSHVLFLFFFLHIFARNVVFKHSFVLFLSLPSLFKMTTRPLAIITGAASGIGHAVAQQLAKTHSLLLIDQAEFGENIQAETLKFDVGQPAEWQKLTDAIKERPVDFVMLNAGVGHKPSWTDPVGWRKMMDTNLFGIVNGIAALLPLIENKRATVVITGSKQGITNPPGNPAYNASKAAVKSLAESLSYDLRKTNVSVHLLIPGYTYTGMTRGTSTSKPDAAWSADQVASYMFAKIEQKQFYILCPDNSVTNEIDNKRMAWNLRDITDGRPALSRWREETASDFEQYMKE
jgi:short-subunit dehydrogenase